MKAYLSGAGFCHVMMSLHQIAYYFLRWSKHWSACARFALRIASAPDFRHFADSRLHRSLALSHKAFSCHKAFSISHQPQQLLRACISPKSLKCTQMF